MNWRALLIGLLQFLTITALVLSGFLGYSGYSDHRAQTLAKDTCAAIRVGRTLEQAHAQLTQIKSYSKSKQLAQDKLTIAFTGAGVERWYCNLTIRNGKVASHEIGKAD